MNRRIFITFVSMLVSLFSVAQDYRIFGTVNVDYNDKPVYLINKNSGDTIARSTVVDGNFGFSGSLDDQAVLDVVVNRIKGLAATVLVGEDTDASVNMTVRPVAVSDNGGINDKLVEMYANVVKVSREVNALGAQLREGGKSEEEVAEATTTAKTGLHDVYRNTIKDNCDNILGAFVLNMVARDLYASYEALDAKMAEVKYSAAFASLKKFCNGLYYAEMTAPGKMFVDFAGLSFDGTSVRLSDYVGKGKYVLVDFWASWCNPCRKEIPEVIEVNRRYAGDNFEVIGININDIHEKFKAAVEELGIDYKQISVPKDCKKEDNAALLYNVEMIPYLILFAPDGTILERGIRGSELNEKIGHRVK